MLKQRKYYKAATLLNNIKFPETFSEKGNGNFGVISTEFYIYINSKKLETIKDERAEKYQASRMSRKYIKYYFLEMS